MINHKPEEEQSRGVVAIVTTLHDQGIISDAANHALAAQVASQAPGLTPDPGRIRHHAVYYARRRADGVLMMCHEVLAQVLWCEGLSYDDTVVNGAATLVRAGVTLRIEVCSYDVYTAGIVARYADFDALSPAEQRDETHGP